MMSTTLGVALKISTHCNTLQRTAPHRNTQCSATLGVAMTIFAKYTHRNPATGNRALSLQLIWEKFCLSVSVSVSVSHTHTPTHPYTYTDTDTDTDIDTDTDTDTNIDTQTHTYTYIHTYLRPEVERWASNSFERNSSCLLAILNSVPKSIIHCTQ